MNFKHKYLKYKKKYLKLKKMIGGVIKEIPIDSIRDRISQHSEIFMRDKIRIGVKLSSIETPIQELETKDPDWGKKLEDYIITNYENFLVANPDRKDFRDKIPNAISMFPFLIRLPSKENSAEQKNAVKKQQIAIVDYENYYFKYIFEHRINYEYIILESLIKNLLNKKFDHINIICKRKETLDNFNTIRKSLQNYDISVSLIFTETSNGSNTSVYPKSTRAIDDCTLILVAMYLKELNFEKVWIFSDDKTLFQDFNKERLLLLPYNITIKCSLNNFEINQVIINPIEDIFFSKDLLTEDIEFLNNKTEFNPSIE